MQISKELPEIVEVIRTSHYSFSSWIAQGVTRTLKLRWCVCGGDKMVLLVYHNILDFSVHH